MPIPMPTRIPRLKTALTHSRFFFLEKRDQISAQNQNLGIGIAIGIAVDEETVAFGHEKLDGRSD
jgi:hypothetical protein